MKSLIVILGILLNYSPASDIGFRYKDGMCVNQNGDKGLNPGYVGQCGDLQGIVLKNLDLTGYDLSGSKFTSSEIQNVNFSESKLEGVSFQSAKITDSIFKKSMNTNTNFSKAAIITSDFSAAEFIHVKFQNANLQGAVFTAIKAIDANFANTKMKKSRMDRSEILNSDFSDADLREANFSESIIKDTILKGARYNKKTILPFNKDTADNLGMILKNREGIFVWTYEANTTELKGLMGSLDKSKGENKVTTFDQLKATDEIIEKISETAIFILPENSGTEASMTFVTSLKDLLMEMMNDGGMIIALGDEQNYFDRLGIVKSSFYSWQGNGQTFKVLLPDHPLAKGLDKQVTSADGLADTRLQQDGVDVIVGGDNSYSQIYAKKVGEGYAFNIGYCFYAVNKDANLLLKNAIELAQQ
jgi:hypothetical protein